MTNGQAIQTLSVVLNQVDPNSPDKFCRVAAQTRGLLVF